MIVGPGLFGGGAASAETLTYLFAPYDYLSNGQGLDALRAVASGTVDVALSGAFGSVTVSGVHIADVDRQPAIAAVFGGHTDVAKAIAQGVVTTLVEIQRERAPGARLDVDQLAQTVVIAVLKELYANNDPAACLIDFQSSYADWSALASQMSSGNTKTGYCQKTLVFPWNASGDITSCKATAFCQTTVDGSGKLVTPGVAAPAPSDLRPPVVASPTPAPLPTHAEIEAAVNAKMKSAGETLANIEFSQELGELAAYLNAVSESKRWLALSLGVKPGSNDHVIGQALGQLGLRPSDVVEWFSACNFDPDCFRRTMNQSIGDAKRDLVDDQAKIAASVFVVAAAGALLFLWKQGRF